MAIALDNTSVSSYYSSPLAPGTYHGMNHTVGAGSNRLLIVLLGPGVSPGSIDFQAAGGDQAFTKFMDANGIEGWYLLNPDVETARIETDTSSGSVVLYGYSFTGATQAAPTIYGTDNESRSDGQVKDIIASPTKGNYVLDFIWGNYAGLTSFTVGSGQTQMAQGGMLSYIIATSYDGYNSDASSVTMDWTCNFSVGSTTIYQGYVVLQDVLSTNTKTFTADGVIAARYTATYTTDGLVRPATQEYSKGDEATLPPDNDDNLETLLDATGYTNVSDSDDTRENQAGVGQNVLFQFKDKHSNNSDQIAASWKGQSSIAPSDATIYLQIFNRTTTTWETLDSDSTTGADTDFTLSGVKTTSLTDYYDANYWVSCRIYQDLS